MRFIRLGISVSICLAIANFAAGQVMSGTQARFARGLEALKQGRFRDAHADLVAAYDALRPLDARDERRCVAAFALASLNFQEGDLRAAEQHYQEAACGKEDTELAAMSFNGLAEAYLSEMRAAEAETALRKALAYLDSKPSANSLALVARRHLAEARIVQGDRANGERMLKALIEDGGKLQPDQQLTAAITFSDLGRLYLDQERFDEAEDVLRQAVEISRKFGEKHPTYADTIVSLATLFRVRGQTERAEPLLRKALKIYDQAGDPKSVTVLAELGACALVDHKYVTAKQHYEKALQMTRQTYGQEHVLAARLEASVATVAMKQGDYRTAQALLEHAYMVVSQKLGPASLDAANINDLARSMKLGPLSAQK